MMKRILLILMVCLAGLTTAAAQGTMTDDQVLQYVIKEHNAGTSQAQIVTKLMQRGVNIQQIRRIKQKYERQMKDGGLGLQADETLSRTDKAVQADETLLRKNNGDTRKGSRSRRLIKDDKQQRADDATSMRSAGGRQYAADEDIDNDDPDYRAMRQEMRGMLSTGDDGDDYFDDEYEYDKAKKDKYRDRGSLYNGKPVFGRDIFNRDDLTFEPAMNIATPQNYTVGPGDVVKLDIYGASQKSDNYTVSPDGDITIDGFGPVNISGLTVGQAQARLRSTLGARYSSSSIKLSLGQTRTITVNVVGEVLTPGTFTLSAFASVFHALYMAGGISEIGTLRNIKVYRRGRLVTVVDVYDYILNGRLTGNVRLADNDVIVVGAFDAMVSVEGKVKRPMLYEMKKTETLGTLIKYAGGFAADAYTKAVRVSRKSGTRYSVHSVEEFDMGAFRLADGDEASVDSIVPRYENTVEIKGAVFRPGKYQLGGEITTVRGLLTRADGVTEDAMTARGVMHRMNADRTLRVISVDVAGIIAGTVADITLENEDVLFIPSKSEQQTNRTVTIHGEVQYPGIYRYADNETLEDFVLQAGGLTDKASTVKVDISRRVYDTRAVRPDSIIARTYSFALKEGFVVDGEQGFTLMPFDEVYVRRSPGYTEQQNVLIEGEINFPGTYALERRASRLSDIVKAAGGVSPLAYVKGARLERHITEEERTRMNQVLRMAQINSGSGDTIDIKKLDIGETYYVGIQLDRALSDVGSDYDLVLREGDRIVVPEYSNTVKVSGNVLYPNTVAYTKGKSAKYYINQAGGFGARAKKGSTYIVHMNGTVNQMGKGEKPTPGSEVIVPTKPKTDAAQLSQWLAIGTSTASIATMIATIANLIK